jgi:tRNA(Ile)-lysidine synthase
MLIEFKNFIKNQTLFKASDRILLAVSGGVDSMVMLDLFAQAQINCVVAHCNFGLRGADSDGDEAFVKEKSQSLGIQCVSKLFDTQNYADQKGISIQMAARELRYAWFKELLNTLNINYLATAHHQNDNLETILLNLLRGTGIAGLRGILPKKGKIVRPLLFATRNEIREYAAQNQIQWREDYSNWENKYRRNLLRNEIIPILKKINPNLDQSIGQTAERVRAVEVLFNKSIIKVKKILVKTDKNITYIPIEPFKKLSEPLIQLAELLKPFGFTYPQSKKIWNSVEQISGKIFSAKEYDLVKDRNQWVISPKIAFENLTWQITESTNSLPTPFFQLNIQIFDNQGIKNIKRDSKVAGLDFEKLKFPLEIRAWREGDYFYPLGMEHKKKISDFLIDLKIPLNLKKQVWVLTSEGKIAWVLGLRIDNRFKIKEKTKQVFELEMCV